MGAAPPGEAGGHSALALSSRRRKARATWCAELLALILTCVYCAIFAHDLTQPNEAHRISSPSWFSRGFCVSWSESSFTSHSLCFLGDVVGGCALVWANLRQYRASPQSRYQVAIAVSVFTVLHGVGHLMIGHLLERDFMSSVRPRNVPVTMTALYFLTATTFLAMGPFLGYVNGVHRLVCVVIHLMAAWAFLEFVPTHFAFGFVQLYLNAWYCGPRVFLLGTTLPDEMARRVDDGWDVVSFGFLALMPVVFVEMLGCDAVIMSYTGHFLYDGAIIVIAYLYSATLWQELPSTCRAPPMEPEALADTAKQRRPLSAASPAARGRLAKAKAS
mmetsp:Transcript_102695/g.287819  ORF Transcript_102695/g.287819 Transcript_102695/m.287819 type:complete len:331 (-) Transcript_102695:5-997(-)